MYYFCVTVQLRHRIDYKYEHYLTRDVALDSKQRRHNRDVNLYHIQSITFNLKLTPRM
jgi:hypothetical protein